MKKIFYLLLYILPALATHAEDGYRLWLRYDLISDKILLNKYSQAITGISINGNSASVIATRDELTKAFLGLLGKKNTLSK